MRHAAFLRWHMGIIALSLRDRSGGIRVTQLDFMSDYLIAPDPAAPRLTRVVAGHDQSGQPVEISVVEERALTIYLNSREIVTAMTIGDYPEYLALGFLRNQGMLGDSDVVTGVDYDVELEVVVVRTAQETSHEEKLQKRQVHGLNQQS